MPISFTTQQRLDITRRQIRIAQENSAFANTSVQLNEQKVALLNVDNANNVFYAFFRIQSDAYEGERRAMDGNIPAMYTDGVVDPFTAGDLASSAKFPGSNEAVFFPNTLPIYTFLIPKIINAVNGMLNPTGTDARYELNIITNADTSVGLTQVLNYLLNGISGGGGTSVVVTPGFVGSNINITNGDGANFSVNDYIYVSDTSRSGIYQITSITPGALMSDPDVLGVLNIFPAAINPAVGATVKNTVPGFTNTERTNLSSAIYQEILNHLTAKVLSLISVEWFNKLGTQITQIGLQNDSRAPQVTQNATALSSDNSAQSVITAWVALPNTGAGAKYTDLGLSTIQTLMSTRQTYIPARVAEITTAVGNVVNNGDGTFSGVLTSTYYNRYKWLNNRINRASGSARRFFDTDSGTSFIATMIANNTSIAGDYDAYFLTKAITQNDGEIILFVTDITGLSVSDTITIVSETQPEISRTIVQLYGNNQVQLNASIPITYIQEDIARLFKTL